MTAVQSIWVCETYKCGHEIQSFEKPVTCLFCGAEGVFKEVKQTPKSTIQYRITRTHGKSKQRSLCNE